MVNIELNKGFVILVLMVLIGIGIAYYYGNNVTVIGAIIAVIAAVIITKNHYQHR